MARPPNGARTPPPAAAPTPQDADRAGDAECGETAGPRPATLRRPTHRLPLRRHNPTPHPAPGGRPPGAGAGPWIRSWSRSWSRPRTWRRCLRPPCASDRHRTVAECTGARSSARPDRSGGRATRPQRLEDFRGARRETQEGGRTVFTEPGLVIVRDPGGQSFVRHNEVDRFLFGARDVRTQQVGGETRTIVVRPDGTEIITIIGPDGQLLRRIRRDPQGREIVIIDNSFRDPRAVGGFYVDLPPPVIRIPYDRYIVDAADASPDLIYDTMEAPPVDRIDRRYSLDEIRYSPSVRMLMPSIDVNTINFDTVHG